MSADLDTLVLGAGISGLSYAHARLRAGADSLLVLDAAPRAGGLVRTSTLPLPPGCGVAGAVRHEWGPEALQDDAPETDALLAELGLRKLLGSSATDRRFVVHDGRLVPLPLSPPAFLKSPLLSWGGKLRALTEPWRARAPGLDGSVAQFVRHRLGEQVLQRLVDPFVSGVYAGDPELLSLQGAFPLLHELVERHGSLLGGLKARAKERRARGEVRRKGPPGLFTVEGGLGGLPDALAAALGERLRLGLRVVELRREGDAWRVRATPVQGGPEAPAARAEPLDVRARRVVVALPAGAVARLFAESDPPLAAELADMPAESVVAVASAWRREQVAHPLDGFGYLVPACERRLHLGTLFSSSIEPGCAPPGVVVLRTLLGGARRPSQVDWPDEELLAELRDGVGALLGFTGEPLLARVVRWRAVLPRYDLRQPRRQAALDALLARRPGLSLIGNWRRGIACNALIAAGRALAREHAGG